MTLPKDDIISGDFSQELVPVIAPAALALAFPQPEGPGNDLELGDLLADALFGEVIDISDMIPRLLSPSSETVLPHLPVVEAAELNIPDARDVLAASSHAADALTMLYDDDILVSEGVIL